MSHKQINIKDELLFARRVCINDFYKIIIGKAPDEGELDYYINCGDPLDLVFLNIKTANYEEHLDKKLPISLVVFTKDSESYIENVINSVIDFVFEVVIIDTGSLDNTVKVCSEYTDRIYKVGFSDFGNIRTMSAHLARQPWVLGLDSDEIISNPEKLKELVFNDSVDAWGIPRRRWADLEMKNQVELEAYPDTQWRLFRNNVNFKYVGRVHESFEGCKEKKVVENGLHIEHFQDVYKSGKKLEDRNAWYEELYEKDIKEGREMNISAVSKVDEV